MVLGEVARYFVSADSSTAHFRHGRPEEEWSEELDSGRRRTEEAMAENTDLELARSPYAHVSWSNLGLKDKADVVLGRFSRRTGWDDRRHDDALFRHG